jgi:hypothetical protein
MTSSLIAIKVLRFSKAKLVFLFFKAISCLIAYQICGKIRSIVADSRKNSIFVIKVDGYALHYSFNISGCRLCPSDADG